MNIIKAIETSYKGYRFRSRLEARWAVFFDALGMKWEYEPEGFVLDDGTHYLPDFRVTSPQGLIFWYEIKPLGVTSEPKVKAFNQSIDRVNQESIKAASDAEGSWHNLPGLQNGVDILAGDPVDWLAGIKITSEGHWDGGCCPRCGNLSQHFAYGVNRWGVEAAVGCQPCDFDTPSGGGNPIEPGLLCATYPHKGALLLEYWQLDAVEDRVRRAALKARGARFEHEERGVRA